MTNSSYVYSLQELSKNDGVLAGGKGANLGELVQAGFPVPPGFVLLTTAYEHFVVHNDLQIKIDRYTTQLTSTHLFAIEDASQAIRELFTTATIPAEIAEAITDAYQKLSNGRVAIRSSATSEDLPTASFAGQHDTFLDVLGVDAVMEMIKRCWSSLWTARAIHYRLRHHITEQVSLAVVIQQMVASSVSGVLFTVNPVTGASDEMLLNTIHGQGEELVSGQVTPNTVVIEKASGQIKQVKMAPDLVGSGTTLKEQRFHETHSMAMSDIMLSAQQVENLTQLASNVEKHFGIPQDIEWTLDEQQHIWLLQARPITTLEQVPTTTPHKPPVPPGDDTWNRELDRPPKNFDLWTRVNVGENLPFPITPLTETNFSTLFGLDKNAAAQPFQATRRIYGRMYINEGGIVHTFEEMGLPASFIHRTWGSRPHKEQVLVNKFRPLRLLRALPSIRKNGFGSQGKGPKHNAQQFFAQINQWVNEFLSKDLSQYDDCALWQMGLPVWSERGEYAFATNLRISTANPLLFPMLERLVKRATGKKELTKDLITSPNGVTSSEIGIALWQLTLLARDAGLQDIILQPGSQAALAQLRNIPTAQQFLAQFEQFLARHGHRCPNELELLQPRWIDAPEQVLQLIANYLHAPDSISPIQAAERQQQQQINAAREVAKRLGPIRRTFFHWLLPKVQQGVATRENSKYYMVKFYYPLRKLYAELGQRWSERGWLKQQEDIFFLTTAEIQQLAESNASMIIAEEWQERVAQRRLAYNFWFTMIAPDAIASDGTTIVEDDEQHQVLTGVPASSGRVKGRARVIRTVQEAMQLQPGEILVTQSTDPGWTPVFPLVSGIIMEIGGQLSHGAIIAREYGIPAIVNVPGAMRQIKDGQYIELDGTTGTIYLDVREALTV